MDTVNPYGSSGSVVVGLARASRGEALAIEGRHTVNDALNNVCGSVVYVVAIHGLAKIGYTTQLRVRLAHLGAPLTSLMLLQPGGRAEERELHLRFADQLVRGREWFRQSGEILEWINSERDAMGVPAVRWPAEIEACAFEAALLDAALDDAV